MRDYPFTEPSGQPEAACVKRRLECGRRELGQLCRVLDCRKPGEEEGPIEVAELGDLKPRMVGGKQKRPGVGGAAIARGLKPAVSHG